MYRRAQKSLHIYLGITALLTHTATPSAPFHTKLPQFSTEMDFTSKATQSPSKYIACGISKITFLLTLKLFLAGQGKFFLPSPFFSNRTRLRYVCTVI